MQHLLGGDTLPPMSQSSDRSQPHYGPLVDSNPSYEGYIPANIPGLVYSLFTRKERYWNV